MNDLQIFENKEFGSVRTLEVDGEVWFVGKDIAEALGYSNASKAVMNHVDEEDKQFTMVDIASSPNGNVPIGQSKTAIINESGLYSLVLSSKLPSAKKFKRWVTHEVIPSIRKHGMYAKDELLDNPDMFISVLQELKAEREEKKRIEAEKKALEVETVEMSRTITEMQPKVNYVDTILQSKATVCTTQIAQDYGMTATAFNKTLRDLGVQHKVAGQWILYRQYLDQGYVQSETVKITRRDGTPDTVMNTKWTQKGRLFLYELLKDNDIFPLIEMGCVG